MATGNHYLTVLTGAVLATAFAGAAAFAAVPSPAGTATMSGRSAHMATTGR